MPVVACAGSRPPARLETTALLHARRRSQQFSDGPRRSAGRHDEDGRVAWLRAGEALERVLLKLTRHEYAASPLTHARARGCGAWGRPTG